MPLAASHSRTVLSSLPLASARPSGLKATLHDAVLVAGELEQFLAAGRLPQPHRFVDSCRWPARCPSGLKATLETVLWWPVNWSSSLPVATSHSRTVLSELPLASARPSGLKATLQTQAWWPVNWRSSLPLATSHSRTVLSALPLASRVPVRAEGHAPDGVFVAGELAAVSLPLAASHSRTVLSTLPLASARPSGLKATLLTEAWWPVNWRSSLPLAVSHSRTVLSSLPLASARPSGLKATLLTEAWWPVNWRSSLPLAVSHSRTVLSSLPLASARPSGLKATLLTEAWWPVNWRSGLPLAASHSRIVPSSWPLATRSKVGCHATQVHGEAPLEEWQRPRVVRHCRAQQFAIVRERRGALRGSEPSPAQAGAGELRALQLRAQEPRAREISLHQRGVGEDGSGQVRADEFRVLRVRRLLRFCADQPRLGQVRAAKVRAHKRLAGEILSAQVLAGEIERGFHAEAVQDFQRVGLGDVFVCRLRAPLRRAPKPTGSFAAGQIAEKLRHQRRHRPRGQQGGGASLLDLLRRLARDEPFHDRLVNEEETTFLIASQQTAGADEVRGNVRRRRRSHRFRHGRGGDLGNLGGRDELLRLLPKPQRDGGDGRPAGLAGERDLRAGRMRPVVFEDEPAFQEQSV